jgi:hypothetical protein
MGQYFFPIFLQYNANTDSYDIIGWIYPFDFSTSLKLMEHSYIGNNLMNTVEYLISSYGKFYKTSIVWSGDYAKNEPNLDYNLHNLVKECNKYKFNNNNKLHKYKYLINHTKKLFVKLRKYKHDNIHPLPLLTSEGNEFGGYNGNDIHLCGTWSRNIISIEKDIEIFTDFQELECHFYELY